MWHARPRGSPDGVSLQAGKGYRTGISSLHPHPPPPNFPRLREVEQGPTSHPQSRGSKVCWGGGAAVQTPTVARPVG